MRIHFKLLIFSFIFIYCLDISSQGIIGGGYHSFFICTDSSVQTCGRNWQGELGDGTTISTSYPTQINSLTGIKAISAGEYHSLFLKTDGTVWACGWNLHGALGDGTNIDRLTPVQVTGISDIVSVKAGYYHSLFLKNDGTVWACGRNNVGQLGDGTTGNRSIPIQVNGLTNIIAIAGGFYHSLFIKNDGTVWACGNNGDGELGDGTFFNRTTPVQVSGLTNITSIAAGVYHSLYVKNDSTVWACGLNGYGQLGAPSSTGINLPVQINGLTGVTAVSAGEYYSLFLKNNGTVWACGRNLHGEQGDGTFNTYKTSPGPVIGLTNITQIATGRYHSLFLKNDSTVWACGNNADGQLGDGTNTNKLIPIQIQNICPVSTSLNETHKIAIEEMKIYPNPIVDEFTAEIEMYQNAKINFKLYNILGETVFNKEENLTKGLMKVKINVSQLAAGNYLLCVTHPTLQITEKIIIK